MTTIHPGRALSLVLALAALALAALALTGATTAADAKGKSERLVVRGTDTVKDTPGPCPGGVCKLELVDGAFRGTPVGAGEYSGEIDLKVAEAFANGEGGVCAPMRGKITLGTGPNRLVLALFGDSCQDGAGPVTETSFTGLARFVVKYGTGTYAKARGYGVMSSSEDAGDQERMTLIGRIWR